MKFRTGLVALLLVGMACTASPEETGTLSPTPEREEPAASPEATPTDAPDESRRRQLVWVAVEDAQKVVLVDVVQQRVVREHDVSGRPHNLTARGPVAVTMPDSGRIALIDRREVTEVDLGGSPHDVKAHGQTLVVANEGAARLDVVSTDGEIIGSVDLKANPHDLAIVPGGDRAWVTLDGTDEVALVDLDKREVIRYVATGRRPHDLLVGPDGRIWVTDWGGELHILSDRGELLQTLGLGEEAHHLAFGGAAGDREWWITDHGAQSVFVVDDRSLDILTELPIDGAPHHVAVTEDGRWAAVADHDNGTVVIFDVARQKRVGVVAVGPGPHGVWAAPA